MAQAKITVNSVIGSNLDLPVNTLVQLNNVDAGGEVTYTWSIVDQPPGTAVVLSSTAIKNPTFTPTKEGSYLVQLVVNSGLASEQTDRVICAVLQVETQLRIPAAGEQLESDSADGWATSTNGALRLLDLLKADPGLLVAQIGTAFAVSANQPVYVSNSAEILTGLPGARRVPVVDLAKADSDPKIHGPVGLCIAGVRGSTAAGALAYVRTYGYAHSVPVSGAPSVTAAVYVTNAGGLSATAGTYTREVATVIKSLGAGVYDLFWHGGAMSPRMSNDEIVLPHSDGTGIRSGSSSWRQGPWLNYSEYWRLLDLLYGYSDEVVSSPFGAQRSIGLFSPMAQAAIGFDGFSASAFIGSFGNYNFLFYAGGYRWGINYSTGELFSHSGRLPITGVANPVSATQAATKEYADGAVDNFIENGRFDFWQRGSAFTAASGFRVAAADRWTVHLSGAGACDLNQSTDAPTGAVYSAVFDRNTGSDTATRSLSQEIDRTLIHGLRGKQVKVTFKAKKGSGYSGGALTIAVRTGASANLVQNAITGYTGGNTTIISTTATLTTDWVEYSTVLSTVIGTGVKEAELRFSWTPASGSGSVNDFVAISEVQLHVGEAVVPFRHAGGSYQNDLHHCQRFFESSYPIGVDPGTADSDSCERYYLADVATPDGTAWPMSRVRFRVKKMSPAEGGALSPSVNLYAPTAATPSKWEISGTNRTCGLSADDFDGFYITNLTGGSITPAAPSWAVGHWTADCDF